MPIRELACRSCGTVVERFLHPSQDAKAQFCEHCGAEMERLFSRFAVVFTGALSARYNDPKRPYAWREGHWVTEFNTPDGKPRKRLLTSFDDQRDYCRQEGLVNPKELPSHAQLVTTDDHESGLRRLMDIPLGYDAERKRTYQKLTAEEIRQAGGAVKQELRSRGLPGQDV